MKWLLIVFSCVFASSCGDNGAANHIDVCANNPVAGCGQACTIDADCLTGLHCGTGGTCRSECVAGMSGTMSGCGATEYCGPNGRCPPSPNNGEGGVTGGCPGLQCQQVARTGGNGTRLT